MKKKKYKILVVILVLYQVFCMIHIPLKLIPNNQKDVQISSVVTHSYSAQNHQYFDSEHNICNLAFFFCESTFIFAIAKFIFTITKVHVYHWQLPRVGISDIIHETNKCSKIPTSCYISVSDRRYYLWIIRKRLLRCWKTLKMRVN